MWLLLIGLFCFLAVIGFFATGRPLKFAVSGIVVLVGIGFFIFAVVVIWSLASPCTAPFSDCQKQTTTASPTISTDDTNAPVTTIANSGTTTSQPSATIDSSSLYSTSSKPTISGSYSNLNGGIGIFITTQPLLSEIPPNGSLNGVVFSDASDHGGGVNMTDTGNSSGEYSDSLWQALPDGTYHIGIYQTGTIYNSNGFQGYSTVSGLCSIRSATPTAQCF